MHEDWYYRIELTPGNFTPGRPIGTLRVLKRLFADVDFEGKRVLDIGTMEFVAPILFGARGAREIVAYDRASLVDAFDELSGHYDLSRTKYLHGRPLIGLKAQMEEEKVDPVFDIVNFTGVLYHCPDPLSSLAVARSFLREGGLMILETSVSTAGDHSALTNHHGALYPGSNYFQVSVPTLDYWCRLLRLEVLDAYWRGSEQVKRAFFILRATDAPVAEEGDTWIHSAFLTDDFRAVGLDYDALASGAPGVAYTPGSLPGKTLFRVGGSGPIDVYRSLDEAPDLDEPIRAFRKQRSRELNEAARKKFEEEGIDPESEDYRENLRSAVKAQLPGDVEKEFSLQQAGSLCRADVETG